MIQHTYCGYNTSPVGAYQNPCTDSKAIVNSEIYTCTQCHCLQIPDRRLSKEKAGCSRYLRFIGIFRVFVSKSQDTFPTFHGQKTEQGQKNGHTFKCLTTKNGIRK